MKKKVLIFEDNKSFADSLQLLINSTDDIECPNTYVDPTFILEAISAHNPDMLLMDIDMPKMSGIEAVEMVRKRYPDLPIVMQTIFEQDDKIYNAVIAGANGYLLKKTTPQKYLEAIRDVIDGGAPMSALVANKVLKLMQNPPKKKGQEFKLTPKETDVLKELVDGLSYKMIAEKLAITYTTVNSHVKKIYSKLHVHNAAEAVSKALKENILSLSALVWLAGESREFIHVLSNI
jgi:DNA-binding NarL/FixJ family response regulator